MCRSIGQVCFVQTLYHPLNSIVVPLLIFSGGSRPRARGGFSFVCSVSISPSDFFLYPRLKGGEPVDLPLPLLFDSLM